MRNPLVLAMAGALLALGFAPGAAAPGVGVCHALSPQCQGVGVSPQAGCGSPVWLPAGALGHTAGVYGQLCGGPPGSQGTVACVMADGRWTCVVGSCPGFPVGFAGSRPLLLVWFCY